MAVSIKGINIQIGADTTKLTTALKGVNGQVVQSARSLREVNNLLKFNPSSTSLLTQKQKLLTTAIEGTKQKITTLKTAREQLASKGKKMTADERKQLATIDRAIIEQENLLKNYQRQLATVSSTGIIKLQALGQSFKAVGDKMVAMGKKMKGVSMVIGASLGISVKNYKSFEDAFKKVRTLTDTSVMSFDEMKDSIVDLSTQTGISAQEIGEAVYQGLSASVDTKDIIAFTREATNLAKTGFTTTSDAVDVLTTIINAYGLEAKDASRISGVLIQTQNDGKTTVDQLAKSMGKVIPSAKSMNVSIEDLGSAYAIMTRNGTNTRNATTQINRVLAELGKEGSDVSAILKDKTGKSFSELMDDGYSLGDVMKILQDSVGGNADKFRNLWKSQVAGQGALAMLSEGTEGYNKQLVKMGASQENVEKNLQRIQSPMLKLQKTMNTLKNISVLLGDALMRALEPVIDKLSSGLEKLYNWFSNLSKGQQELVAKILLIVVAIAPVLIIVGKIIGLIGTVLASIGTIISVCGAVATAVTGVATALMGVLLPIAPIIIGIGLLIAVGVLLYKNWDKIKERFKVFTEGFNTFKKGFVDKMTKALANLKTYIGNAFISIVTKVNSFRSKVASIFSGLKDKILHPVKTAFDKLKSYKLGKLFGDIKVPHIKVVGGKSPFGIGGKGKKPSISIEWYKRAMQLGRILNGATIFGQGTDGSLLGGGETGREVVVGQNSLLSMINASMRNNTMTLADSIVNGLGASLVGVGGASGDITIQVQMYPSGQTFEREIVRAYDRGKAKGY